MKLLNVRRPAGLLLDAPEVLWHESEVGEKWQLLCLM